MNKALLTYALNKDGNLVHVDSVKNGLECCCTCPGCNTPVIAKNEGEIREHHFAHANNEECVTGYQTMIHLLAKAIILEKRIIPGFGQNGKLIIASKIRSEVRLENLNIIPDVLAIAPVQLVYGAIGTITKDIPFIIEIRVTHKVDDEKANIIIKAGIPAVEIDLSKSTATTAEELLKDILNPENWKYINKDVGQQFAPRITLPSLPIRRAYGINPRPPIRRTPYKRFYRKKR